MRKFFSDHLDFDDEFILEVFGVHITIVMIALKVPKKAKQNKPDTLFIFINNPPHT